MDQKPMDQNNQCTPAPDHQAAASVLQNETIAELREEGEDFLADLIALFESETPARLRLLANAIATGDCQTAGRAAHTLKGSAAVFGASAMVGVAAAAETAARSGEMRKVARLLDALRGESERVLGALRVERARSRPAGA